MTKLTCTNIRKTLQGKTILDDISLELESGKIYVFVGPNGSGKTMLFRALSGLMSLDEGTVELDGKKLGTDFSVLPSLGITIEHAGLYADLTGFENLSYLASLKKKAGKEDIRKAIERVGLDPDDKRTYRKYSLGMKQRIAIAQAVMEQPDVLMLDEPTNGLDRNGCEEIRNLILEEKQRGALVLLASHSTEDIRILADRIYEIENGKIIETKEAQS